MSKIQNNRIQTTADDMPIQVGNKYFLIADKDAPAPKMICLSNLKTSGENAIVETKAAPPNQRAYPALANFND